MSAAPPTTAPPTSPASQQDSGTAPLSQTQSAPTGQPSKSEPPQPLGAPVPPSTTSSAPQMSTTPVAPPALPVSSTADSKPKEQHSDAAPATPASRPDAPRDPAASSASTQLPPTAISDKTLPKEPEHITPAPAKLPAHLDPQTAGDPSLKSEPSPALGVPAGTAPDRPKSPSIGVQRVDTIVDLTPHSKSTPATPSEAGHDKTEKPSGLALPQRPGYSRAPSSADLKSGQPSPRLPDGAVHHLVKSVAAERPSTPDPLVIIILFAGPPRKPFEVHKHSLISHVPHFKRLFAHDKTPDVNELTFEDLDEYGFALFVRWLYGGKLHGPNDFHSFQHYFSLYVLAHRFDIEPLCNNVMDLCRAYYRHHSMTAPAYRIEYIYTYTKTPNHMRNFLLTTAAYRCLCDAPIAPGVHMSDSMKTLIGKGGDVAVDFAESLIKLSKNGIVDVRRSTDCTFHEHSDGHYCDKAGLEPYMNE